MSAFGLFAADFSSRLIRSIVVRTGPLTKGPKDMSFDAFLQETRFMQKVTPTMPRPFYPGKSRPLLQGLPLTKEQIEGLKDLFFDSDGSLSSSIARDIDTSGKHGYINFQNHLCLRQRNDLRWQVPIRKHGCGECQNPTRSHHSGVLVCSDLLFCLAKSLWSKPETQRRSSCDG